MLLLTINLISANKLFAKYEYDYVTNLCFNEWNFIISKQNALKVGFGKYLFKNFLSYLENNDEKNIKLYLSLFSEYISIIYYKGKCYEEIEQEFNINLLNILNFLDNRNDIFFETIKNICIFYERQNCKTENDCVYNQKNINDIIEENKNRDNICEIYGALPRNRCVKNILLLIFETHQKYFYLNENALKEIEDDEILLFEISDRLLKNNNSSSLLVMLNNISIKNHFKLLGFWCNNKKGFDMIFDKLKNIDKELCLSIFNKK